MLALAQIQGPWWCPMCPGGAWGWGMMLFMILFWLLVIALVIWLVYRLAGGGRAPGAPPRGDRAEAILRERYARGEIDKETYDRMLEDLRRGGEVQG